MTLRPSTVPPYTLDGIRWQCWITDENTYVWRSQCGQFEAWRRGRHFFASRNGKAGGRTHDTLLAAMGSAQQQRAVA